MAPAILDPFALRPPSQEGLLPRPELLPGDGTTLLVVAPAGYGKTSLLAQWAAQRYAAWLTLTPASNEPAHLAASLAAALGVAPFFKDATDDNLATDAALETLRRALAGRALVIDSLETLTDPTSRAVIDALVDGAAGYALALGSRVDPALPALSRRRVRRQLFEVDSDSLTLRGETLDRFLRDSLGLSLDETSVRTLEERTGGWAALVVLAADRLRRLPTHVPGDSAIRALRGDAPALYDFLAAEVLDNLPRPLREFLLRASLLPKVDATVCERLVGALFENETEPADALRELERRRLLILADDGVSLSIHPLFADFLRARLRGELGAPTLKRLCRDAARVLGAGGAWDTAFALWDAAADPDAIADAFETTLFDRWTLYRGRVRDLPESATVERPRLLTIRGEIARQEMRFDAAEDALLRAESLFRERENPAGEAEAMLIRARVLLHQGRRDDGAKLMDAVDDRSETLPPTVRFRLAMQQANRAAADDQNHDRARKFLDDAVRLARADGNVLQEAEALAFRAMTADRWYGRFDRIRETIHELRARFDDDPPAPIAADLAILRYLLAAARLDPDPRDAFETYLRTAKTIGNRQREREASAMLAVFHAANGEPETARAYLEDVSPTEFLTHLCRAYLAANDNDPGGVRRALGGLSDFYTHTIGVARTFYFCDPLLRAGDSETAARVATRALAAATQAQMPYDATMARFYRAIASNDSDDYSQSLMEFRERGWLEMLARLHPPLVARFLNGALSRGIETDLCLSQLESLGVPTARIRGFGGLCVWIDGREASWARPKARALFALLWLADSRPLLVEQVVDALWPEADSECGRQSYRTHCTYLRQAIGSECLETTHRSIRLVLPDARIDDRAVLKKAHASNDPAALLSALSLIGDEPFLPEFAYDEWSAGERETQRARRRDVRLRAAKSAPPETAFAPARAALDEDPLDEDAAVAACLALRALDKTPEARALWTLFAARLAEELNAAPSPQARKKIEASLEG